MLWMITKFIFCLLAAGILGFIIGWILSSLIKNEKSEEKYALLYEDFETRRAELNQAYSDLDSKEQELTLSHNEIQQLKKELMMKNMDIEEFQKNGFVSHEPTELELENNTLKEEISEYKYLENENELLHNELKELGLEKEKLMQKIESFMPSNPILTDADTETASTKSHALKEAQIKRLQNDLKKAKKRLSKMATYLAGLEKKKKKKDEKKSSSKKKKKEDEPIIFDFHKES
jgi:chromosome segregation ATPase